MPVQVERICRRNSASSVWTKSNIGCTWEGHRWTFFILLPGHSSKYDPGPANLGMTVQAPSSSFKLHQATTSASLGASLSTKFRHDSTGTTRIPYSRPNQNELIEEFCFTSPSREEIWEHGKPLIEKSRKKRSTVCGWRKSTFICWTCCWMREQPSHWSLKLLVLTQLQCQTKLQSSWFLLVYCYINIEITA